MSLPQTPTRLLRPLTVLLALVLPQMPGAIAKDDIQRKPMPLSATSQAALDRFALPAGTPEGKLALNANELAHLTSELVRRYGRYCSAGACSGLRPPRPKLDELEEMRQGIKALQQTYGL